MPVKITMVDHATGETRNYVDTYATSEKYEDNFQWSEGNFSCDCNRGMFFYDDENDYPCFDEKYNGNRFEVIGWEKL